MGAVTERRRLIELHREAVVFAEAMRHAANRHFDPPLLHPNLLVDADVARTRFVADTCAGR